MTQKKEAKTKIKVRDLKPKKDAKGGFASNQNTQSHNQKNSQTVNMVFGGG